MGSSSGPGERRWWTSVCEAWWRTGGGDGLIECAGLYLFILGNQIIKRIKLKFN